jgi:hypothetical protein
MFFLIVLLALAGCETPQLEPLQDEDVLGAQLLSFLADGYTTRERVLLELGTPSAQFEGQRILTYQIRASTTGDVEVFWPRRSEIHPVMTNWQNDIFSLVLVFDDAGVLARHSVVGAK